MKYLELSLPAPEENLALDEWLLQQTEDSGVETLRLWESSRPFVVLGRSNSLAGEVDTEACRQRNIPILRRVSGGGTVVQGPGCLSYAVTLAIPPAGPLASITGTNRWIMERHQNAISSLIGQPVEVKGHSDLALAGRKFSGNAQKRGRSAFLFHGTLLHAADLALMAAALRHPKVEPDWREGRSHGEFITNLPTDRTALCAALRHAWDATDDLLERPDDLTLAKLADRHREAAWIAAR